MILIELYWLPELRKYRNYTKSFRFYFVMNDFANSFIYEL